MDLFEEMTNIINETLGSSFNIVVEKSICNSTALRQDEAKKISTICELMIIIGGKKSSNTHKLYEVSKENCRNAIHIETKDELDMDYVKQFKTIGIMAGASTPDYIINDVINVCKSV